MIRAALVPYLGGRAALAISGGSAAFARAWDVGELQPNPNASLERDHAFLRVVEPHHVQELLENVLRLLVEHRVEALTIEEPRGSGAAAGWGRQVGDAVADGARSRGIAVEYRGRVVPAPGGDVPAVRHAVALLGAETVTVRCEVVAAPSRVAAPRAPAAPPVTAPPTTPTEPCVVGYDLGSAQMGAAFLADTLPLDVLHAVTLGVDPKDLDVVVAVAVELAVRMRATRAAIEHGMKFHPPWFSIPEGSTATQIKAILERRQRQIISMAEEHAICGKLQEKLSSALQAAGIEAVTWARETWAHRVVPHHQGGVSNAEAKAGVRALCAPGSWEALSDDHQRDAAGTACMWLIDPPARPKRPSRASPSAPPKPVYTPEQKVELRRQQVRECQRAHPAGGRPVDASAAERAAAGCTCTAKHRSDCPVKIARDAARAATARGSFLRPDVFK